MDNLVNDVRFALRLLVRSPGFTAVAVLSIALGIGVNTTVFTLVDAVLLRPLPVAHPEGVVEIYTTSDDLPYSSSSYPDYLDLRREASVFEDVAGHSLMLAPMTRDGRPRVILGEVVTANYFERARGAACPRTQLPARGERGGRRR